MYDIKSSNNVEKDFAPKTKYPFGKMKDGDYFVGDRKAADAAQSYGRAHAIKFSRQKIGEDEFKILRRYKEDRIPCKVCGHVKYINSRETAEQLEVNPEIEIDGSEDWTGPPV